MSTFLFGGERFADARRASASFCSRCSAGACSRKPATIDISPQDASRSTASSAPSACGPGPRQEGQPFESGSPTWSSSETRGRRGGPGGRLVAKKAGKASSRRRFEKLSRAGAGRGRRRQRDRDRSPSARLVGPGRHVDPAVLDHQGLQGQAPFTSSRLWTSSRREGRTVSDGGRGHLGRRPARPRSSRKIGDIRAPARSP